jgi:hypothetical protein
MLNANDTRLKYDNNSYQEQLERSVFPGAYQINTPYNDCNDCAQIVPNDPFIRYQNYGQTSCSMKKAIDDNSELYGLNYKNSKCNKDAYKPNTYISTGCKPKTTEDIRTCSTPTESCRLSNPPCTLKETGINRFDPLCWNPQDKAIESFDRIGVNYRMVAKDNHIPLIEKPEKQDKFIPQSYEDYSRDLSKWSSIHQDNKTYSPGYPFRNPNYVLSCKTDLTGTCY